MQFQPRKIAHSNKLQIKVFIIEYENDVIERDSKSFCGIYSLQNRKRRHKLQKEPKARKKNLLWRWYKWKYLRRGLDIYLQRDSGHQRTQLKNASERTRKRVHKSSSPLALSHDTTTAIPFTRWWLTCHTLCHLELYYWFHMFMAPRDFSRESQSEIDWQRLRVW